MSDVLRICLVGATGLTGTTLIQETVGRPAVRVVGISRREMRVPEGARMEVLLADPTGWPEAIASSRSQVLVCALGTTWRNSGQNEAAFRAVDHDLVLNCAMAAKQAGIERMIVVSSVGADAASRNRYLRVKGEMEQGLAGIGFKRLDILRPGLIRGGRVERRWAERLAMVVSPLTDLFLWGDFRKYRSMPVRSLAQAILGLAREKASGRFVHQHDAILRAPRRTGG